MHNSQLERDLIRERVVNGLKAAVERGVRLGRKKTRPSQLIRRLRLKKLTYKEIARIAGCSQGAVGSELKAWVKEKEDGISTSDNISEDDISLIENSSAGELQMEELPELELEPLQVVRY